MNLFTTLVCFGIVALSYYVNGNGSVRRKCCEFNEIFENFNGTYKCAEDRTRRRQIKTDETGFLNANSTGECFEVVGEDFSIFNVTNNEAVPLGQVVEQVFPKCCPLNEVYNSVLHSCEERRSLNQSYIKENFLRIGLSHCNVIVDYQLNGTLDLRDSSFSIYTRNNLGPISSYCVDETNGGGIVVRECKDGLEICEEIRCFKKCCPDGQSFIDGDSCYDTYKFGLDVSKWVDAIENITDQFAIIHNRTCTSIFNVDNDKYHFKIDSKGIFSYYTNNTPLINEGLDESNSYCIEHTRAVANNMDGYYVFKCFGESHLEEKFQYKYYAFLLSCFSLVLTVAVYIVLEEVRKVFGKILVLYCLTMLMETITLTVASSNSVPSVTECQIRAFAIVLFGCASFSWSNVICWDIWCTFGSTRSHRRRPSSNDMKKILYYTLYGWGLPIFLTFLIWIFYKFDKILPERIQPHLGDETCFFETISGNYAHSLFFSFPLLILELINIVLFFKTVIYCWKVKNEINKINDTTKNDKSQKFKKEKERLFLILKLSIIMGISFTFEVVSGFLRMDNMGAFAKYVEMTWDMVNALQGVYIFLIFICKKTVFEALMKKVIKTRLSPQVSTATQSSQQ